MGGIRKNDDGVPGNSHGQSIELQVTSKVLSYTTMCEYPRKVETGTGYRMRPILIVLLRRGSRETGRSVDQRVQGQEYLLQVTG